MPTNIHPSHSHTYCHTAKNLDANRCQSPKAWRICIQIQFNMNSAYYLCDSYVCSSTMSVSLCVINDSTSLDLIWLTINQRRSINLQQKDGFCRTSRTLLVQGAASAWFRSCLGIRISYLICPRHFWNLWFRLTIICCLSFTPAVIILFC